MQMRPRHYSTMNRAVARSVTYALRGYGKKSKRSKYTYLNQDNNSVSPISNETAIAISIIGLIFLVGLAFLYPGLWILYFILLIFI